MADAFVVIGAGILVVGVAFYAGARVERWRAERVRQRRGLERLLRQWQMIHEFSDRAKVGAFERAAQAVTMWPHRVVRRADLARHLLSLATAPELGAPAPNPAATPEVEDAPTTRVSPGPAAAPVPERSLSPEPESQLNVMEGFL